MDKKISSEIINKRRRNMYVKIGVIFVLTISILTFIIYSLRTELSQEDIVISVVEKGNLDATVSATGKVVPLHEEIITSPIESKILSVYKKTGDKVEENESILELDMVSFNANLEKLKDEIKIKKAELEQQRITSDIQLSDMAIQIEIDEMKLERMSVLLNNERYLDSIGAGTDDKIKQAELELKVQTLQLEQLKQKYRNQQKMNAANIQALEINYNIAVKNMNLMQKTVTKAEVRSPRKAIITWVNEQIGSNVNQGAELAIISDGKGFKIEGEIADGYVDKIASGNKAEIHIGNVSLTGKVGNVVPSVKNGIIKFTILPDDNNNPKLHSGLKVEIHIVSSIKSDVLLIDKRNYYVGGGLYEMWVINDNKAIKRNVRLGDSSYDKVEVIEGLHEGDKVIVSNMNNYSDKKEMFIK